VIAAKSTRCKDGGVAAASLPARILDESLVSDRIVIDTVDGWLMRVGELPELISRRMKHRWMCK